MRRKIFRLLTPVAVVLAVVFSQLAPAYAADDRVFWGNLCDNDNQCMNDTQGGKPAAIQFWGHTTYGEPNNDWNVWQVPGYTTVNCEDGYPFGQLYVTPADCESMGLNGDSVYKIAFAPHGTGSGYCLYSGDFLYQIVNGETSSVLDTTTCSPSGSTNNGFLFVQVGPYLMSVLATIYAYQEENAVNRPVWVTTCPGDNNADGENVCLSIDTPTPWYFDPTP